MKTANPLRKVRIGGSRRPWPDAVAAYMSAPRTYWSAELSRHAERVEISTRAVGERDGLREADIIDAVVSMARKRRIGRPAGVHVTGMPGSGTDQTARMLDGVRGLVDVGEVGMPDRLLEELRSYSDADQACAVDALSILHGWPDNPGVWAAGIVSRADDVHRMPLYKRWYPGSVGVHVVRDPRNQVRAAAVDDQRGPEGRTSEGEDLRRLMHDTVTSFRDYRAVANAVDVLCRYEDLQTDADAVVGRVVRLLPRRVGARLNDRAVQTPAEIFQHPAPLPEDPALQRVLHSYLVDVVRGLGYPPGDCMGTHLPGGELPARQLRFRGAAPGPLYQRQKGTWVALEASGGSVDVPAGAPVLLRIGTSDPGGLAAVEGCDADDLQAVCLASNDTIDDNALRSLRGLRGLQTLDLARTRVTDEGLSQLHTLTGLQQLHLADTQTTASGRARLAKRLPQLMMWA